MSSERRRFPRLDAAVFCRPTGLGARFRAWQNRVQDVSLGGIRLYSDDALQVGDVFDLEIFDQSQSFSVEAKVVWVETLGEGQPARFDIGLEFISLSADATARLRALRR